jgi:hypothetical protein
LLRAHRFSPPSQLVCLQLAHATTGPYRREIDSALPPSATMAHMAPSPFVAALPTICGTAFHREGSGGSSSGVDPATFMGSTAGLFSPDIELGSESPFAMGHNAHNSRHEVLPSQPALQHHHHHHPGVSHSHGQHHVRFARAASVIPNFAPSLGRHAAEIDELLLASDMTMPQQSRTPGAEQGEHLYQQQQQRHQQGSACDASRLSARDAVSLNASRATTPSMSSRRTPRRSLADAFDDEPDANSNSWPRECLRERLRLARASPQPYHVPTARRLATDPGARNSRARRPNSVSTLAGQMESLCQPQYAFSRADGMLTTAAATSLPPPNLPQFSVVEAHTDTEATSPTTTAALASQLLESLTPADVFALPDAPLGLATDAPTITITLAAAAAAAAAEPSAAQQRMYARSCLPLFASHSADGMLAAPVSLPPSVLSPHQARRHVSFARTPAAARATAPAADGFEQPPASAAPFVNPSFARMFSMVRVCVCVCVCVLMAGCMSPSLALSCTLVPDFKRSPLPQPSLPQAAAPVDRHEHILPLVTTEL